MATTMREVVKLVAVTTADGFVDLMLRWSDGFVETTRCQSYTVVEADLTIMYLDGERRLRLDRLGHDAR